MNYLLTVVFENGFCELYLPNVNNKTVPLDVKPAISGYAKDITLPLEVWGEEWTLSSSKQFTIMYDEEPVEKVKLASGLLLNCEMKKEPDLVFSLTVVEVDAGNTRFGKYFLNSSTTPKVTIGNAEQNNVRFDNSFVSPTHAEISFEDGHAVVRDLNSVNGTFVNGRLLSGARQLQYGDVIYIIGLKIVYLDNILAVNNPGGKVIMNGMRVIEIPPTSEEEIEEIEIEEEQYFLRTPRRLQPLDTESFTVEKNKAKQKQKRQPIIFTIGPAFTMVIPMAVGAMMSMGEGGMVVPGLIMSAGAAAIGAIWGIVNTRYMAKSEAEEEQQRVNAYMSYITGIAQQVQGKMQYNRQALETQHPSAQEMLNIGRTGDHRLWEKTTMHEDFLQPRLGVGDIPSPNVIETAKEQTLGEYDPLNMKAEEMKNELAMLCSVPVALSLYEHPLVGVVSSDRDKAFNLCNIISMQLAGGHPYTDLRLCYVYSSAEEDQWKYTRYLPHVWSPDGKIRTICCDKASVGDVMYYLTGVLRERTEALNAQKDVEATKVLPHYVVMVSDWSLIEEEPIAKYLLNPSPDLGLSVVLVVDAEDKLPSGCTSIIRADDSFAGFYSTVSAFPTQNVNFDIVDVRGMEDFARSISNYRVREMNVSTAIPEMLTFLDMYKTSRVEDLDMMHKWLENRTYESMRSMVGYKSGNQPLYLDIHEKYHGPHGLVAGTTGSGKSETLQSYILSLVVNYHPHEVAFILIDYKGGGMAQSFLGLPHLSGVITNLGGNATNRALLSINAEIKNRQRIFNEYKVKHIDAYIELYRSGVATEPMPHLLIIADEFAELKKEQPEFVRALVSAARVGRSLDVNLILATQKPSGVVDDEIWSNTRFRLCLRVADKQDSAEMLKRPDAAYITGTGRGFFQVGNDEIFEEFQSGWSGAEYEPDVPFTDDKNVKVEMLSLIGKSAAPKRKKEKKSDNIAKLTQLDAVIKYAAKLAEENNIAAIKQIWLPPLPTRIYMEDLDLAKKPDGFSLILPIGLADNPESQSQFPVYVDFLAEGNLLVCGTAGSGKTTLLQTMVYGAAMRYSPQEVNFYIADFSSRTMAVFTSLPHVGGVMFEGDDEKISDTFEFLQKTLARRKSEFSQQGIGSFKEYVTQNDDCPAIVFMLDNLVAFNESYDQYSDQLVQLSREGASYGIYIVISAGSAGDIRSRLQQNFTRGIALQMPDKYEYEAVVGDRTEIVPEGRIAGRGLIKDPLPMEFQVALCVRETEGNSQAQTLRRMFETMSFEGGGARKVGEAPEDVVYETFARRADVKALPENILPIGLNQDEDKLVSLSLDDEFCTIVGGSPNTGKTNFLKTVACLAKDKNASVYIVDGPDRELLEFAKAIKVNGYANDVSSLFELMNKVLVPHFSQRNGIVAATREAGGYIPAALEKFNRIYLLINDIENFMTCVYNETSDMSKFMEVALQKGCQHKIQIIAAITPDNYLDMARYSAMRTFAGYGRGLHFGGMLDQQTMLNFGLNSSDTVRQLQAGTAWALDGQCVPCKVVTPLYPSEKEDE